MGTCAAAAPKHVPRLTIKRKLYIPGRDSTRETLSSIEFKTCKSMLSDEIELIEYQQDDSNQEFQALKLCSGPQRRTVLQVEGKNQSLGVSSIHCFNHIPNLHRRRHQVRNR
ncbi:hypothetical protein NL676_022633 [Syzygium grande]|nr:hypothetical protein NL676_022633 [Syzygium grande]